MDPSLLDDAKDRVIVALMLELQASKREIKLLKEDHALELQSAVEEALREERARLAEQAAAAQYKQAQRRLWLRSPDCVLQVLCLVAMTGHDARGFANLTRAFRGDEVLWGCIKERRGRFGRTVLMACSWSGNLARVRWLLEQGADVNAANHGRTSLMWACKEGYTKQGSNLELVRELLKQGADVNAAQKYNGDTSLIWACQNNNFEVVRELLGRGANANAARTSGDGMTSLMLACQLGYVDIVRELLGRGANINAVRTDDGRTSLMVASQKEHLEIVSELLRRGADVDAARTYDGLTPLMIACRDGHLEVARLLLVHHANRALVSVGGRTAYDLTPRANAELRALVKP